MKLQKEAKIVNNFFYEFVKYVMLIPGAIKKAFVVIQNQSVQIFPMYSSKAMEFNV